MKTKTNKGLKIAGNIAIWLIFAIALVTVIVSLNTSNGFPSIFGVGYLSVQSDSMEGEDGFYEGDLIFVTKTQPTDVFEVGDVVTFKTTIAGVETLNTHRIVSYTTLADRRYYITKGDNEESPDLDAITSEDDIIALYTGFRIGKMGKVSDFIQSQLGFFLCIVLPLALVFIYQLVHFGIIVSKYKKEKVSSEVNFDALSDEQKEEIAKKYLEALNAKKEDK
jgi:signal peptidase